MKVRWLMERAGISKTGMGTRYLKDALKEIAYYAPTHISNSSINIVKDKRFYDIPKDAIKITGIQCKNHLNTKDEYRRIPRMIGEPYTTDDDSK